MTRPCTRHAANGVTVPAGPDGLCGSCRVRVSAPSRRPVIVPQRPEDPLTLKRQEAARKGSAALSASRAARKALYRSLRADGESPEEEAAQAGVPVPYAMEHFEDYGEDEAMPCT